MRHNSPNSVVCTLLFAFASALLGGCGGGGGTSGGTTGGPSPGVGDFTVTGTPPAQIAQGDTVTIPITVTAAG